MTCAHVLFLQLRAASSPVPEFRFESKGVDGESLFRYLLPQIPKVHEHLRFWQRALLDGVFSSQDTTEKYILGRGGPDTR